MEIEEKRTEGDREIITYRYEKEWKSSKVSQGSFHSPELCDGPSNPDSWPCDNETFVVNAATLGIIELTSSQIERIDDHKDVPLSSPMGQGTVLQTAQYAASGMF